MRKVLPLAILLALVSATGAVWQWNRLPRTSPLKRAGIQLSGYLDAQFGRRGAPIFGVAYLGPSRGGARLYLIHGLGHRSEQWEVPPLDLIATKRDAQIVMIDLPEARARNFTDDGRSYCDAFVTWLNRTDRDLDLRFGSPATKAVAGVSYGGLHAIIAARRLSQITTYAAISPVTDVSALDEFRFVSNAACSPLIDPPRNKRGLVVYSTDDTRVKASLIVRAVRLSGARAMVSHGLGHRTSREQALAVRDFLR